MRRDTDCWLPAGSIRAFEKLFELGKPVGGCRYRLALPSLIFSAYLANTTSLERKIGNP
jgi:hypothetical protein